MIICVEHWSNHRMEVYAIDLMRLFSSPSYSNLINVRFLNVVSRQIWFSSISRFIYNWQKWQVHSHSNLRLWNTSACHIHIENVWTVSSIISALYAIQKHNQTRINRQRYAKKIQNKDTVAQQFLRFFLSLIPPPGFQRRCKLTMTRQSTNIISFNAPLFMCFFFRKRASEGGGGGRKGLVSL